AVKNFGKYGCFITCHNDSRHMPEWKSANGHDGKYVIPSLVADGGRSTKKVLDLWHWRGARSNPIWKADDQWIETKKFVNINKKDNGGRHGDAGTGVFRAQKMKDGHPTFVLDPATTFGKYAFKWVDFWRTPFYYMTDPDAVNLGPTAPNPQVLAWDEAIKRGYKPSEGDVVPRRVLRAGKGSRADISAFGTVFVPTTLDGSLGVWKVQMQRKLNTGHDDDIALNPGKIYDVGFEVHLWEYTTRDHYVSFPLKLSLGSKSKADIRAVRLPGRGTFPLPDWDNTKRFPVKRVYLFQPGINTWEFLNGDNEAKGKVYIDPVTGKAVEQEHPGSDDIRKGTKSCAQCHRVRIGDPPTEEEGGPMEQLARQRGGTWTRTPVTRK
ncbi:MAG: ethylbenzene dehydrogenase-related protein, partial [bacterium]